MIQPLAQDEYGEVYNDPKTCEGIARMLEDNGSVIIGWTDQAGSHFDILFAVQPIQVGNLSGGQSARTDLFVAISGIGMFGFSLESSELHPSYVAEKLTIGEGGTADALAVLVSGVRDALLDIQED